MLVLQTAADLIIANHCTERGVAEWVVDKDHKAYAIVAKHDKDYQALHDTANKMGAHFCETAHSHVFTGGLRQIVTEAEEFSTHIQDWFIGRINYELREMSEITRYYVSENIILYESVLERIKEEADKDVAGKMSEIDYRIRMIEDYVEKQNGSLMGLFTPTQYDINMAVYFVKREVGKGKVIVVLFKANPFNVLQDYAFYLSNEEAVKLLERVPKSREVEFKGANLLSVYARNYPNKPTLSYLSDFCSLLARTAKE